MAVLFGRCAIRRHACATGIKLAGIVLTPYRGASVGIDLEQRTFWCSASRCCLCVFPPGVPRGLKPAARRVRTRLSQAKREYT